ncbi:hypothetical protein ACFLZT_03860 [Thermodesulfobacteriota bacterium]
MIEKDVSFRKTTTSYYSKDSNVKKENPLAANAARGFFKSII